jgi:hypothetical protein
MESHPIDKGPLGSWSYGNWIYNYLCNQCLSPLKVWVRIPLMQDVLDTTLCDKVCQWLATGWWFSPDTLVSSTNKTDRQYNCNIVKSGVKHHKPNLYKSIYRCAARMSWFLQLSDIWMDHQFSTSIYQWMVVYKLCYISRAYF